MKPGSVGWQFSQLSIQPLLSDHALHDWLNSPEDLYIGAEAKL